LGGDGARSNPEESDSTTSAPKWIVKEVTKAPASDDRIMATPSYLA
jgi:hypothetical protein